MTRSETKKKSSTATTIDAELNTDISESTTTSIKQVTPIKAKKKKLLKKSPKKSPKKPPKELVYNNKKFTKIDIIYTESVGEFVVATICRQDGSPGYCYPILKAMKEGNNNLTNDCMFDCRIKAPLFIRQSRQDNQKVNLNIRNNNNLYWLGFVSRPDTGRFKFSNLSSDDGSTLKDEKIF